jgi:Ca2+-binding EF-hand superfamily protein
MENTLHVPQIIVILNKNRSWNLELTQVHDILNKYDNGSGQLSYPEFRRILHRKVREADLETNYKESFRVFSKENTEHITCRRLFDFKLFLKLSRWERGK